MHRDTPAGSRLNVANAYALGHLMTREEFIASLDMEAAVAQMDSLGWPLPSEMPPPGWVKAEVRAIIDAAIGEDT